MEITNFYRLDSKLSSTTFQAHAVSLKENNIGLDDHWKLLLGDYTSIEFPVIFRQEYGNKLHDLLDTGWPSLYLISDKMKITLEENKLLGWRIFPIIVYDKQKNEVQGYHGLTNLGRCGPIDFSKSELQMKSMVENGPVSKYYKGLYVGLNKWDGTDFFMAKGYFSHIVTKKTMEVIKKAKLTNIKFTKLSNIETCEMTVNAYKENILENSQYF